MKESKGSNVRILTCPWISLCDRKTLYCQLFQGTNEEKISAIKCLDAWKARCQPHVPLGIEVTAALVQALAWENTEREKLGSGELESMFCMALIRFVNLITDVSKASNVTGSINSIAEKMGVPEWIVDLRHAATHSNVPSLQILTVAATWCLEWIRLNYWAVEDTYITDVAKMPSLYTSEQVCRALFDVKRLLPVAQGCTSVEKDVAKNKLNVIMRNIQRSTSSRKLAKALAVDGLLFPESRDTSPPEIRDDTSLAMHQFNSWKPVLKFLQPMDGLLHLIDVLIVEINRRPATRRQFSIIWIPLIIEKFHLLSKKVMADKVQTNRFPLAVGHLPKEKQEKLENVTKNAACGPIAGIVPSDLTSPCMPTDEHVVTCPLGILPMQRGSTRLDLELPGHVDLIYGQCKCSNLDESTTTSNVHHSDNGPVETLAWLL